MNLADKHCVSLKKDASPLSEQEENEQINKVSGWNLDRKGDHKITQAFDFKDFKKTISFVNDLADIAEREGHHPDLGVHYNKVDVEFSSHAINGLSENDFIMAAKTNQLYKGYA